MSSEGGTCHVNGIRKLNMIVYKGKMDGVGTFVHIHHSSMPVGLETVMVRN